MLSINTSTVDDIWYVLLIWNNGNSYRIAHIQRRVSFLQGDSVARDPKLLSIKIMLLR